MSSLLLSINERVGSVTAGADIRGDQSEPTCNICGSTQWKEKPGRPTFKCAGCGATERARLMRLVMDATGFPKPGMRVLHFAPERAIYRSLRGVLGDGYECADFNPELFPKVDNIRKIDLVNDLEKLESNSYDAITHIHVMEHIPCNITAVLCGA